MNILAKKQWRMLERGISEEERKKREKVFLDAYFRLREKEERNFLNRMSLAIKKRWHNLALTVLKIKNRLGRLKYEIVKDERSKTDRAAIFAVTHVSKPDIEIVFEAIKDHCYLLTGDFERLQGRIESLFLSVNGVIYSNQRVKEDRKNVVSKMIEHLKAGGNLMYFPEGVWNVSPNLPVLPCYWGIVEVARKSNAVTNVKEQFYIE